MIKMVGRDTKTFQKTRNKSKLLLIIVLVLSISFIAAINTETVQAQACVCQGHTCQPGQSQYGADCGNCGTLRRDCTTGCDWGSWYCWNEGVCSPGSTQCTDSGQRHQTCSGACAWVYDGTDADSDGTDAECGDAACDIEPAIVDAQRLTYEYGSCPYGTGYSCATCNDGIDNDCNADGVDLADNSESPIECCSNTFKDCRQFTLREIKKLRDKPAIRAKHSFLFNEMNSFMEANYDSINDPNIDYKSIEDGNDPTTFRACTQSVSDIICCSNPSACVWGGTCYPNMTKQDFDGDGIREICVASSPGEWVDEVELDCNNGIDDDYDGFIDCADSDCNGIIEGLVLSDTSDIIENARVELHDADFNVLQTDFSNSTGGYGFEAACGDYNMITTADNYVTRLTYNVNLPETDTIDPGIIMYHADVCEADCTLVSGNTIRESCDGENGCSFFDTQAAGVCDNAQPGWIRDYNESHYIECPDGTPYTKQSSAAVVTCSEENLIKRTKAVTYKGELVKLVVVTCGT